MMRHNIDNRSMVFQEEESKRGIVRGGILVPSFARKNDLVVAGGAGERVLLFLVNQLKDAFRAQRMQAW